MSRAFTSADILHQDSNTIPGGATDPGIAFTTPATAGNSGIIVVGAGTQVNPPEQWHYAGQAGAAAYGATQIAVLSRPDLLTGETSWALPTLAGTPKWAWIAEEWTNISYAPQQGSSGSGQLSAPASAATGSTGAFTAEYVAGIAALLVYGGVNAAVWSAVTWDNGFTETDVLSCGTGTGGGDIQVRVARRYGTRNDAGPWSTTATFTGGTQTGKLGYICLAVLAAERYVGEA